MNLLIPSQGSSVTVMKYSNLSFQLYKKLWHLRLGHPSERVLDQVLRSCNIKIKANKRYFCEPCQYGKNRALPFKLSDSRATCPLQLIHTDLWGPSPVQSSSGYRYYIQFLDDFSRYSWIYPLKNTNEAFPIFLQYKRFVEKQFEKSIKVVQSDWGGEYRSFSQFFQNEGVIFRQSCPHTSVQNGRVERRHRQIVEVGLTLLAQASMPLQYWWDSFQNVVFLINRLPSTTINNLSPYFTLFNKHPDYSSIRVFGSACYPNLRSYNPHKFAYHTTKFFFLGLSGQHKGFHCLSSTGRLYISRHVIFNKDDFPFKETFLNTRKEEQPISSSSPLLSTMDFLTWQSHTDTNTHNSYSFNDESLDNGESSLSPPSCDNPSPSQPQETKQSKEYIPVTDISQLEVQLDIPETQQSLADGAQPEQAEQPEFNTSRIVTRSMKGISKPNMKGMSKPKAPYVGSITVTSSATEPQSVTEAPSIPHWKQAMRHEFNALQRNHTWELVPYHSDLSIVDCKWMYKTKYKANGDIERFKARLVAKGFQQDPGVSFGNRFSPVARIAYIRIILALATALNWKVRQLDVNNAFLNVVLQENVYMW